MSNQPPIHFVISAPRSGSTWLTTALNGHPEVFATEHRLFGDFAEVWQNNDGSTSPRLTFDSFAKSFAVHYFHDELGMKRREFLDVFQASFAKFVVDFALQRSGAKVVIDKITPYPGTAQRVVDNIRERFPDSKIIQLVRDGRDVATSGTFDWLLKDAHGTDRYRHFVDHDRSIPLTRFFDDEAIRKWADNWRETIDAFAKCPADLRVTYEGMKTDQASELRKVFALLEIETDSQVVDACVERSTFERMSGRMAGTEEPTAKARKGIVGDWRNYFTPADARLFDRLAGQALVDLGYEPDNSWVASLESA